MTYSKKFFVLALSVSLLGLAGCASQGPIPYAGLATSSKLQANLADDAYKTPYQYSDAVQWADYSKIVIDPVDIYAGKDNQFDGLSEDDKRDLATYMDSEFSRVLGARFGLGNPADPGTLRLKLTLTGAKTNTAVVSTFTRFDLLGGPANVVQSIRGKEGVFIGNVSYSVAVYDSVSNRLLLAYVTRQFPNALNVGATFGSLSASRTGIDKGAEDLLAKLR